jgi:hypothetical protein
VRAHYREIALGAKSCGRCGIEKPLAEFTKNSSAIDGRGARCVPCNREYHAARYRKNPARQAKATRAWRSANPEHRREIERKYRAADPERARAKARAHYAAKAEHIRETKRRWIERNKERDLRRAAAWARLNRGKINAKKARRKAAKLQATPAWANHAEIRGIYKTASLLGPGFHVDHIVPLRGGAVCGLHCEANLRIIPAQTNMAKHARWWPDMFGGAVS